MMICLFRIWTPVFICTEKPSQIYLVIYVVQRLKTLKRAVVHLQFHIKMATENDSIFTI